MKPSVQVDSRLLSLAPDTYVDSCPTTGLSTLHLPGGAIPLSETAAIILRLCNGRNRRKDIVSHLRLLGQAHSQIDVDAFIDAACQRRWVTQVELPRSDKMTMVPTCARTM